jgi:hypothetical protein
MSPPSASSVTATVKVLSYPVSCPTRIDQSPLVSLNPTLNNLIYHPPAAQKSSKINVRWTLPCLIFGSSCMKGIVT